MGKSSSRSKAARLALEESDEFEGGDEIDDVKDDQKKKSVDEVDDDEDEEDEDFDDDEDLDEDDDEDDDDDIADDAVPWMNTAATTHMWELINTHSTEKLREWLKSEPQIVRIRSEDGRGPLWWAYENGHMDIVDLLVESGAKEDEKDSPARLRKTCLKN